METNKEHGRIEQREIWALAIRPEDIGFCAAAQIVRIRRRFTTVSSGQQSDETVFGVSSLRPLPDLRENARCLMDIARDHWSIENGNHYVRDRTFDEDRCPVRHPNRARILATLRSLACFMTQRGFHKPRTAYHRTVPSFNRFCQYNRSAALRWLVT